jgi:hypothetical protein
MDIYKSSSYHKIRGVSNTNIRLLMLNRETLAFYSQNHKMDMNISCGQNADLLNIKADGAY